MGDRPRIVLMPGNDVLCDPRVLKNLAAASSFGMDAIALGVVRTGRPPRRQIGDAQVRTFLVPLPDEEAGVGARMRRVREAIRLGYISEEQEEQARARLRYFIREVSAAKARAQRDAGRDPISHHRRGSGRVFAGRLRIIAAKGIVKFRAYLGRRRRVAELARAANALDHAAAIAEARKAVRWRKEYPTAIDDDIVLGRELDRLRPDIIHVHDVFMMGVAARAAGRAALKGREVRLVYDAHEYLPGLAGSPPELIAAYCDLEQEFLPDFDRVITVSRSLAELLLEDHGLRRRPDLVINASMVDHEAEGVPRVRDVIGLAEDVPLLIYGGGINSARGVDTVIEGLVDLPEVHFVLVVRVPNSVTADLLRVAEDLGVSDRVHLAGFVPSDHVVRYFASADIGVSPLLHCPNHDVALTNKFCEYLLAGIPVITSDTPEQAGLVTDLGVGEVYPAGDAEAFARAVRKVLNRLPELRARIADPEIQYRFSWSAQEEVLRGVYSDLLGVEVGAAMPEANAATRATQAGPAELASAAPQS